ncbi:hypothetical protein HPP92_007376 [Vanilla planifolia]|uniref:Uncharacterized protein n=1 Tax=Vanilla planifolia TaxID=51239 RepID=A0A835RHF6_VANPL|nr:hypothetical protein HPP92_007376 [Vanilla planifolia]
MGFICSNRSRQSVTRAAPRLKTSSKNCIPRPQDVLRSQGSNDSKAEDIDLEQQLKLAAAMSDENDLTWLSSDSSPSLLDVDPSGDIWDLDSLNLSLPETKPLMLHSSSSLSDLDVLRDLAANVSAEFLKKDCSLKDKSVQFYEGSYFSNDSSVHEVSCLCGSSCVSWKRMVDSACKTGESNRKNVWVSSLNLYQEGSEVVHEIDVVAESTFDSSNSSYSSSGYTPSDSSSPSSSTICFDPESRSSSDEVEYDEPLFWPYDEDMYKLLGWGICVSPPKGGRFVGSKANNVLKAAEAKLRKINSLPARRNSLQMQRGRRIEFNKTLKKPPAEYKTIAPLTKTVQNSKDPNLQISRNTSQISNKLSLLNRLIKGGNSSQKKEPLRNNYKIQTYKQEDLCKKPLLDIEAVSLQDFLVKDDSIENLVGLNEFDGREGLNGDFSCSEDICFIL